MSAVSSSSVKPLTGITVVDFSQLLPGPLATLMLAKWGARVIRVVPPHGDLVSSMFIDGDGVALLDRELNAAKESVVLDLKTPEGHARAVELCAVAQVVIESSRPGIMERLGLGYTFLRQANPALVYCSITGYGQAGTFHDRAGHDINYLALSGLLDQSGNAQSGPALWNFPLADILGGSMTAAASISAALVQASTTGAGSYIDVAMTPAIMQLDVLSKAERQLAGNELARGQGYLCGKWPCYRLYRTSDGRHLAVGAMEYKFWARFCDALGVPHLIDSGLAEGQAGAQAIAVCEQIIGAQPLAHWQALFHDIDCCVTPVLNRTEAEEFFSIIN